jgi:hypothetical protein
MSRAVVLKVLFADPKISAIISQGYVSVLATLKFINFLIKGVMFW